MRDRGRVRKGWKDRRSSSRGGEMWGRPMQFLHIVSGVIRFNTPILGVFSHFHFKQTRVERKHLAEWRSWHFKDFWINCESWFLYLYCQKSIHVTLLLAQRLLFHQKDKIKNRKSSMGEASSPGTACIIKVESFQQRPGFDSDPLHFPACQPPSLSAAANQTKANIQKREVFMKRLCEQWPPV